MSHRPKILVVDDNYSLCKSLQVFLSSLDVDVTTSSTGKDAKALIIADTFDIIMLDFVLPDTTFSQMMDHIDSRGGDTLVILMSGSAPKDMTGHLSRERVHGFLQKPFELSELLTTVQSALDQRIQQRRAESQIRWDGQNRRSRGDRRCLWKERRLVTDPWYGGHERRSGKKRRCGTDRRRPLPPTPIREKRQHRRAHVNWPLEIKGPRGSMRGQVKNVSSGGAFICTSDSLKLHDMVAMEVDEVSLSTQALSILAKVVRSNIYCIDEVTYPYGTGVEFVVISDDGHVIVSNFVSQHAAPSDTSSAAQTIELSREGEKTMAEERRSVEIMLTPKLYPTIKVVFKDNHSPESPVLEASSPLHKEVWLSLAKDCKDHASQMDVVASQELVSVLHQFADSIMSEIHAEEKRERNRDAYAAFADFVAEINSRADLDNVRKAQMIHDRAAELKLD
ncbi:MAG TPA: response regulator [Syntrophobacteria bacterium]|nr:response regulator [Syntrophobacteria bacterium]